MRRKEGTPREQLGQLYEERQACEAAIRSAKRLLEEAEEEVLKNAQVALSVWMAGVSSCRCQQCAICSAKRTCWRRLGKKAQ